MNNKNKYINFVLTGDKNYSLPIAVAITSILKNIENKRIKRFFLLTTDFTKESIDNIYELQKDYSFELINIEIKDYLYLFNKIDTNKSQIPYVSLATYYRFLMFKILPDDVDKCFYIDGDIIVDTDLSLIYDELQDDKLASVVVETFAMKYKKHILAHCYELECFSNFKNDNIKYPYFNAGFLLINIEMSKKLHIFDKLIDLVNKYPNMPFVDQDIINAVIGQNYSHIINYLDPSYNVFCDVDYTQGYNDAYYP